MNREIKFRAYSKRKEKIENVVGLDWLDSGTFKANVTKSSEWYEPHINGTFDGKEVEEFVLMQFTGLKDNNGKEIYEGDIIDIFPEAPDFKKGYAIVFEEGEFRIDVNPPMNRRISQFANKVEVIGNVFENPSLINK